MRTHFHPTPSETVQRYLFYSRTRRAGESVSMYVAELKKLAEFCNFGDTLEPMLRDRIVCGIGNERWQRRLLGEEDLTYKSAMKIVLALESADSQVKELQGATKIHHVRKPWQSQRPKRQDTLPQIGVASAPSIFQRTMENILQGLPGVTVYIERFISKSYFVNSVV